MRLYSYPSPCTCPSFDKIHFNLASMTFRLCLKISCDSYMTKKRWNDSCLCSQQCVSLRNGHIADTNPSQYVTEVRLSTGMATTESRESHIVDGLNAATGRPPIPPPLPRRPTDRSLSEYIAYVSRFGTVCFYPFKHDRPIFCHIYRQLQVSHPRSLSNV